MISKTLVTVAFVAMCFVASVSALRWELCENFNTNVTKVEMPSCVAPFMSPPAFVTRQKERACPIASGSDVDFSVQYTDLNPINRAVVRLDFENGDYSEAVAAVNELTRFEVFKIKFVAGSLPVSGQKIGDTKMRLTIREYGSVVAQVCVEIPVDLQ